MYDFKKIEKKWQDFWHENNLFNAKDDYSLPKKYNLVEFPYPSGAGMHLGHIKAYIGLEILSRMQRMQGYNVLFPMGFDAFGLPAENYAMKVGKHPSVVTEENVEHFLDQLKKIGFSFDTNRIVNTTDKNYYKWTQWIFLKMLENNLVYRDKTYVNYCPKCKVVLANEDSQGGKCDRCDSNVVLKEKDVWFLRITKYADKLLEGLESVDYPARVKTEQINWIGKSKGAYVNFKIKDSNESLRVYTTRPDTLFGATFMVIAPEHPLIQTLKNRISNMDKIDKYKENASHKSEFERTQVNKDKTGEKIEGVVAVNPVNNKEIPIYIADYVMMGYGTGAIMAVPAHDDRDFEFAKKFDIPVIPVVSPANNEELPYAGEGTMVNSEFLNGIDNKAESINKMIEFLKDKNLGEEAVQYHMKDWAFNRQRYWGEPIPIIHCPKCGIVPVPYEELPLELPDLLDFLPGPDGESPLANVVSWVNCKCPKCGDNAKRETDTMPQWAGSSWYFLRYTDPHNDNELANSEKLKYWMQVDWYNGGSEHITRHMIYARFWHHFLYDIGIVPCSEPFKKRSTTGLILGSDGAKMSKSLNNTVDPLDIVETYGADVLRAYVLFMGDYTDDAPWSEQGLKGIKRFLERIWSFFENKDNIKDNSSKELERIYNYTIKKVTNDYETMKYNTAISQMMIFINEVYKEKFIPKYMMEGFVKILNPVAPHMAEEIWHEILGYNSSLVNAVWPKYDETKTLSDEVNIAVSINGKLRSTITMNKDEEENIVKETALNDEKVKKHLEGKEIIKVIVVPNRILNIVIK